MGHVNLANLLVPDGELAVAREHYEIALRLDSNHPQAHQGLGTLLAELGDHANAAMHRRKGYEKQFITTLPYRGTRAPLPLLLLVSAAGGDIPTASFLDDRVFLSHVVVAEFCGPDVELPPHRLIFNSIGDADLCRPALEAAAALVKRSPAPVINRPGPVLDTGRLANAQRLGSLSGVVTPRMISMPRARLAEPDGPASLSERGFAFPLLLRSPGFHTGRNFVQAANAAELAAAAAALPGDEVLVIAYLDAPRRDNGNSRKYPSSSWTVAPIPCTSPSRGTGRCTTSPPTWPIAPITVVRTRHFSTTCRRCWAARRITAALERIRDALGLDYGGIDFGLGPAGDVLLFEANATMVVNPPDPDERWAYRRAAVARILDAIRCHDDLGRLLKKSVRASTMTGNWDLGPAKRLRSRHHG